MYLLQQLIWYHHLADGASPAASTSSPNVNTSSTAFSLRLREADHEIYHGKPWIGVRLFMIWVQEIVFAPFNTLFDK